VTRSFDDVAVGEELVELRRVVRREDVKAYADVGGDHNALHQDDEFARSVGFQGIIAHGMFTMGHMATSVVEWAGGDPEAILRLSAHFRAPVYMGEEIVASGRVQSLDAASRTATVQTWVTVERDGAIEHAIKRGEAIVRLA
jgi:acyl dehydratase